MTATFQIGDKVTALGQRQVTITYGPFLSTFDRYEMYVAADGAGRERSYQTTDLTTLPAFAVGDDVMFGGCPAKIAGGPVVGFHTDERLYLVTLTDGEYAGKGDMAREGALSAALADEPIKVGDLVRIVYAKYAEEQHGKTGVVTSTSEDWRGWIGDTHPYSVLLANGDAVYARDVERVDEPLANTYTHNGVTYDLAAKYRDNDGDEWEFARFGAEVEGGIYGAPKYPGDGDELGYVVRTYGPLTRV